MPTVLRRLLLWTVICAVSAAPSFLLAKDEFNRAAMALGVCLFIAAYTVATSTAAFERFHRRPFVRRTFYIGYGARLVLSMLMPLGMPGIGMPGFSIPPMFILMFPDIWPGFISLRVVDAIGLEPESFAGTLATTIVQGALLNLIIFFFMLIVYGVQRPFLKLPPDHAPRGFDVVLEPATGASSSEVKP